MCSAFQAERQRFVPTVSALRQLLELSASRLSRCKQPDLDAGQLGCLNRIGIDKGLLGIGAFTSVLFAGIGHSDYRLLMRRVAVGIRDTANVSGFAGALDSHAVADSNFTLIGHDLD